MDVKALWDSRAGSLLTQDVLAKQLEVQTILRYVERSGAQTVVDMGCGDGALAVAIAQKFPVKVIGIDYSEAMLEACDTREAVVRHTLKGEVEFRLGDVREGGPESELTITERCLINLPDWAAQKDAIKKLSRNTKALLLCENSRDGLDHLNEMRARVDLPRIVPPEHNAYLPDHLVSTLDLFPLGRLQVDHYSDLYYFLSRVVNAAIARREDREPDYLSQINWLAIELPAMYLGCGQGKIWYWT